MRRGLSYIIVVLALGAVPAHSGAVPVATNDLRQLATPISQLPFSATVSNLPATNDPDDLGCSNYLTLWYRLEFPVATAVTISGGSRSSGLLEPLLGAGIFKDTGSGLQKAECLVGPTMKFVVEAGSAVYLQLGSWFWPEPGQWEITMTASTGIAGKITDESGNALAGTCVQAQSPGSTKRYAGKTWINGTYGLPGLPPGEYTVQFGADGSSCVGSGEHSSEYFSDKPDLASADRVVVVDGSVTAKVNAALAGGSALGGTITDVSGAGIAACVVASGLTATRSIRSDPDGHYLMRIPKGLYKVSAYDCIEGFRQRRWYPNATTSTEAETVDVSVGDRTGIDLALPPYPPPANDSFAAATVIPRRSDGKNYYDSFEPRGASKEEGELPCQINAAALRTVWYRYTPETDERALAEVWGPQAAFGGIYIATDEPPSVGRLIPLECFYIQSNTHLLRAGVTYYFQAGTHRSRWNDSGMSFILRPSTRLPLT